MDNVTKAPKFLLFILLSLFTVDISSGLDQTLGDEILHRTSSRKELNIQTTKHDSTLDNPPIDIFPTSTDPPFVTIPSANPAPSPPFPTNNPGIITNPGLTNPNPSSNNPLLPPPITDGSTTNQRWCVAKSGISDATIQSALDYACGGGADCSSIQQGGSCYDPNTLLNHASYAFNSLYQKNQGKVTCDFGGCAVLTSVDPSSGSCSFTASSPSSSMPQTIPSPDVVVTTPSSDIPTTPTSFGAPPVNGVIIGSPPTNPSNPDATTTGIAYQSPPLTANTNNPTISMSSKSLQPALHFIVLTMTMFFITRLAIM